MRLIFWIMHLLSTQGAPIKQALLDAGIGTDIYGGYDSSSYQPIFSIVAKHANASDQKRFVQIIREVSAGAGGERN